MGWQTYVWAAIAAVALVYGASHTGWWRWSLRHRHFWFQRRRVDAIVGNRCYEGLPGSCKTVRGVQDLIGYMRRGVRCASNITVRDPKSGIRAEPCGGWMEMFRLSVDALERRERIVFLIDEVGCWADSRMWAKVPQFFDDFMRTRRHFGVGMILTAQNLFQIDKRLRGLLDEFIRIEPAIERWSHLGWIFTTGCKVTGSDANEAVELADKRHMGWIRGWAFNAYNTAELVPSHTWSDDEEMLAEARALWARAQELTIAPEIPAYVDRKPKVAA